MNLGELFVKLKIAADPKNAEQVSKFRAGLISLKDRANDFRKQANEIIKSKFSHFFKESEFASLGFLGKLTDIVGKANMVRLAILAVVAAMVKLTQNAADASEHLFKFSLNTGLSTTNLQKWQHQAEQVGVSADEVAGSFAALQQKAMDIQLGQGDARAFQLSGVSWFADAETQLGQIEKMLATRPAAMGTKLAMDMGLSEDMITFLRLRAQLKPADQGLILSPDEIKELKDFSIDFKATWAAFQNALKKLGAMILPITRPFMNFARRLTQVGTEIISWMNAVQSRKNIILATIAAIGTALAVAFFPATTTIIGIVAAIGAVLLAIEDVASFIRGDDSLTGRSWEGLKKGFAIAVDYVKQAWSDMLDWVVTKADNIFQAIFDPIRKLMALKDVFDNPADSLSAAWENVKEFFTPATPALAPAVGMMGGSSAIQQNIQIRVDGAKEPAAVAKEIQSHLRKQTSDAVYQMPRQEQ